MKRHLTLFLLFLPVCLQAQTQNVTVSAGVPPAVSVNASYRGASGFASIYYYVCARFVSGSVCTTQPAVAGHTAGVENLGGGNSVTVSWAPGAVGATGYDVIRTTTPGFTSSCPACAIALNTSATSYVDSSPSSGSAYPPNGIVPAKPASGQISLDNLYYSPAALAWNFGGTEYLFCFAGSTIAGCSGGSSGFTQLHQDVNAGPGTGNVAATVVGLEGVPFCNGFAPTASQFLQYSTALSPVPCYTAATVGAGNGITQLTTDVLAGPGSGVQGAEVVGIQHVPLCTGFSPTNGQVLEYTTGGSPNPCYGALTPSTGTITFSATPTATAIVTDTNSTQIQTPSATTTLDTSGDISTPGYVATGVNSGALGEILWGDASSPTQLITTWQNAATGYTGTLTINGSPGPTQGQVWTATTCSGANCTMGWTTPVPPTTNQNIRTVGATFGDFTSGAAALTAASTACVRSFFSGTIQQVTVLGNPSGSATVDVRTSTATTYASSGPGGTTTITASDTPALSSAYLYNDTTLTGWTTAVAAGTVFCFYLTSPTTVAGVEISIKIAAN